MTTNQKNWSGHVPFRSLRFHQPQTIAELQAIVRNAEQVRVVGAGHTFNDLADTTGDLISLGQMDNIVTIDRQRHTATVNAGITYFELCPQLHQAGYALPNLASLSHITVIGACMTATHGSGDALGNLATAVSAVEIVTANGELVTFSRQQDGDRFNGVVVALGGLGVVSKVTLDLRPTFALQQHIYRNLPWTQLDEHFDAIMSAGYSVSLFTNWQQQDRIDSIWIKWRLTDNLPLTVPATLFGATLAPSLQEMDAASDRHSTAMGVPGPWYDRLPHFYFKDALLEGNELQSEYFVPRRDAVAALRSILPLHEKLAPIIGVTEVRSVTADSLWMSTAYGQDVVGIHFNWQKKWPEVRQVLPIIEEKLAPFGARPHWGKLFVMPAEQLQPLYPRLADFRSLLREFDPQGKFCNTYLNTYLF